MTRRPRAGSPPAGGDGPSGRSSRPRTPRGRSPPPRRTRRPPGRTCAGRAPAKALDGADRGLHLGGELGWHLDDLVGGAGVCRGLLEDLLLRIAVGFEV